MRDLPRTLTFFICSQRALDKNIDLQDSRLNENFGGILNNPGYSSELYSTFETDL